MTFKDYVAYLHAYVHEQVRGAKLETRIERLLERLEAENNTVIAEDVVLKQWVEEIKQTIKSRRGKITPNTDPESRAFWDSVEKVAQEVATWPEWKRKRLIDVYPAA